jgi:methylmalonyl-CoA mutase N-terminal domain/subunit
LLTNWIHCLAFYSTSLMSPRSKSLSTKPHQRNAAQAPARLQQLQQVAVANGNLFEELMETVKYCSLGQITNALFEVGGQYRRNM